MSAGGRGGGLRSLGASLETWTPARGRAIDPLHAIAAAWPGIVGADVAAQSAPLLLARSYQPLTRTLQSERHLGCMHSYFHLPRNIIQK
ncbi:MAG: hypothetical protein NVS4B5_16000 [Vulcanimicrobiaceae bacterium]